MALCAPMRAIRFLARLRKRRRRVFRTTALLLIVPGTTAQNDAELSAGVEMTVACKWALERKRIPSFGMRANTARDILPNLVFIGLMVLDAVRGASEACNQAVVTYCAGANERSNKEMR